MLLDGMEDRQDRLSDNLSLLTTEAAFCDRQATDEFHIMQTDL
jgi:hypothetical protein